MSTGYTIWFKPSVDGPSNPVYWAEDKSLIDYLISFYTSKFPNHFFWIL